jgi:hypothetical protein
LDSIERFHLLIKAPPFPDLAGRDSAGIPKDSIVQYEIELKTGKFLVVAHGSEAEVAKAMDILTPSIVTEASA